MNPVLPGSTIGVLGSGQLGRMFAIAARRMGYRVHTFSPDRDTPTGQVADYECEAEYSNLDKVREFARGVSVVTFEFENVPADTAAAAAEFATVRPAGSVLHTTQNRLREKNFLARCGIPTTAFAAIRNPADLAAAVQSIGLPGVLKTAAFGYDGKGQQTLKTAADLAAAADGPLKSGECIYEGFVDFEREISVVAARGADGQFAHFGAIDNTHYRHILDLSVAPADLPPKIVADAVKIARTILDALEVVGVLCVEMFLTRSGKLLVNELAPRPHNSGHLTIDAFSTSQFEQQLRAVCGLPMGSTRLFRPAAMANLLGDLWEKGEPNWPAALAMPDVHLHLYGKADARPGRKMGHLTATADTPAQAVELARRARQMLQAVST